MLKRPEGDLTSSEPSSINLKTLWSFSTKLGNAVYKQKKVGLLARKQKAWTPRAQFGAKTTNSIHNRRNWDTSFCLVACEK